tara:strand:- start:50 stop:592 length:543 start_codon:yes stop_codon:yes gene_type:complete
MRRLLRITIVCLGLILNINFVNAGMEYKEEIDKSNVNKTASYKSIIDSECSLTKSLKSKLLYCFFFHSTNTSKYPFPLIGLGTIAKGWEHPSGYERLSISSIITYDNGKEERIELPVIYKGSSLTESFQAFTVNEVIMIPVEKIKSKLKNIIKIEFEFGSAEYLWINDKELTNKVLNYVE